MKKQIYYLLAALMFTIFGSYSALGVQPVTTMSLVPNNIKTPYSIGDLPISKRNVIVISLMNNGRVRISVVGDAKDGLSTHRLLSLIAKEALSCSKIDVNNVTTSQLNKFASLPDIGMTVKQWAENYKRSLAELKVVNSKGMMPREDSDETFSESVRGWLTVIMNVSNEINLYRRQEPKETIVTAVDFGEDILAEEEEEVDLEVVLWNSNVIPEEKNKNLNGFDMVIVADESCNYVNVERLFSDIYRYRFPSKFIISKRSVNEEGGFRMGARNSRCISFTGIGDFRENYDVISENYKEIGKKNRELTVIVDNVRDAQGITIIDGSTGRHKLNSWVIPPGKTISGAIKREFSENENMMRKGLRKVLYDHNTVVNNDVKNLGALLYRKRISEKEYLKEIKNMSMKYEENSDAPYVVLKFAPGATYEAFIAAIDEMYINNILYWRIGKLTTEEKRFIETKSLK